MNEKADVKMPIAKYQREAARRNNKNKKVMTDAAAVPDDSAIDIAELNKSIEAAN